MRVFITGATGFVGRQIVKELLASEYQPVCLVRPNSVHKIADLQDQIELSRTDIFDYEALKQATQNCDAIIHLIGIIRENPWKDVTFQRYHIEATQNIVNAAKENHIQRFILMSGLGVEKEIDTGYMNTKRQIERMVIDNDFAYTIFRPSIIFGEEDDFINRFLKMIRNPLLPFVPVVGDGKYLLQPISIRDVAQAFVRSLTIDQAKKEIYDLAGNEKISMNQLLNLLGAAIHKENLIKLHIPVPVLLLPAYLLQNIPQFPITIDQIKMLMVSNTTNKWHTAYQDFNITPFLFRDYLRQL